MAITKVSLCNTAEEIEEIKKRIEFLIRTGDISLYDKIAIAKKALEILENNTEQSN